LLHLSASHVQIGADAAEKQEYKESRHHTRNDSGLLAGI
jgi:hypothetical protein